MDSERFSFYDEALGEIPFQPLPPDALEDAVHHVELVRHLQEIWQLFQMVLFNLRVMRKNYEWMSSGEVQYREGPAEGQEHFIAVNALVVNLIGSARTLTEAMDCYMREAEPAGSPAAQSYRKFSSQIYDDSFAYRFLIRLRDFSQHGHPPVSQDGANYRFDLLQITRTPHFAHNQQIKRQMDDAVRKILEEYHDQPTLGVTMTVAEFTVGLFRIYDHFLSCAEAHLRDSFARFRAVLREHPENTVEREGYPALYVYDVQDRTAHMVLLDDDAMEMLGSFQQEAKETLGRFQHDWDHLREGMVFLTPET